MKNHAELKYHIMVIEVMLPKIKDVRQKASLEYVLNAAKKYAGEKENEN